MTQFEIFESDRTSEAINASLPSYVTEVDCHRDAGRPVHAIGNPWTRERFDGDFYLSSPTGPGRLACSLVFVQSKDRNTGARNPAALGGGKTDKHLIYEGLSRVAADGVLAGAETVRGGGLVFSVWHPELVRLRESLGKPRHPAQIIATLRGLDLTRGLLFNTPRLPVVLLTIGECARAMRGTLATRPWITAVVMDDARDLQGAFAELMERGIARLSCVGGRTIATQLIDAGLVQDIYLTTAAKDGGEPHTPFYPRPLSARTVLRKHGTGPETGVVFEHLLVGENGDGRERINTEKRNNGAIQSGRISPT